VPVKFGTECAAQIAFEHGPLLVERKREGKALGVEFVSRIHLPTEERQSNGLEHRSSLALPTRNAAWCRCEVLTTPSGLISLARRRRSRITRIQIPAGAEYPRLAHSLESTIAAEGYSYGFDRLDSDVCSHLFWVAAESDIPAPERNFRYPSGATCDAN
jgi:hypothetical protein